MGNSLSQDSQAVLDAATAGDVHLLKQQIACEPKLLDSVTLVKRRGVLHLAAKQGHPHVISTVLDPLLDAVRREYHAHLEAEKQREQEEALQQQQQQQQAQDIAAQDDRQSGDQAQRSQPHEPEHPGQPSPQQQQQQQQQQEAPASSNQSTSGRQAASQPEVQLASFKRLRSTVNARDLYRRTPLIVAAKQGHLECAHLLVDAASNLFAVDREGNTSLHYAALHGHAEVVEYLVQRACDRGLGPRFVNKRNLSGFTALHYAVWSCRPGVVVPLLAAGADICAVNDRVFDAWVPVPIGSTPLHLAVMRASVPVAVLLLQHYVLMLTNGPQDRPRPTDPRNLVNLYGMNPAQLAAHRNNRQMAQLLMPSVSLSRVLSVHAPPPPRVFGPRSLKSIAAAVVQQTLTNRLDSLEAAETALTQQQQGHCSSSSKDNSSCAMPAQGKKASCSLVCVQACSSEDSDAGRAQAVRHESAGSADVDLIVLHTDISAGITPASSRSASPEGSDAVHPAGAANGSCMSAFAATSCAVPAGSPRAKTVTFSAADRRESSDYAADAAASCAEATGALRHALTTASSSGWYDELCCVCWESEVTAYIEPCMHAMCLGCARQLVGCSGTTGPTCPLCRAYIAGFGQVPHNARQQAGKRKKCLLAGTGI